MLAHGLDALVKDAPELTDLLRIFRQRLLPPTVDAARSNAMSVVGLAGMT